MQNFDFCHLTKCDHGYLKYWLRSWSKFVPFDHGYVEISGHDEEILPLPLNHVLLTLKNSGHIFTGTK